ncbi:MAG: PqqD family protein [Desulfobulbaceae bacterium]|jgi:hypothetical protein|nr:PqqD family protein [Desulfobulbaceae bacterium]
MSIQYERNTLYTKNWEIVERSIENSQLLVNPQTDSIFHLNQMGAAIWRLLEQPITVDEIVQTVQVAFPENPENMINSDVEKIVRQFIEKNLILYAKANQADPP